MYHVDSRVFPSTEQGLKALVQKPDDDPVPAFWPTGGYLNKLPKDPWGRDYYYQLDRSKGEARIFTLGRDGVTGGFGQDRLGRVFQRTKRRMDRKEKAGDGS
jgi:general secretion pathway protein G